MNGIILEEEEPRECNHGSPAFDDDDDASDDDDFIPMGRANADGHYEDTEEHRPRINSNEDMVRRVREMMENSARDDERRDAAVTEQEAEPRNNAPESAARLAALGAQDSARAPLVDHQDPDDMHDDGRNQRTQRRSRPESCSIT